MPVKWQNIKPGDIIRVYERGMLAGGYNAKVIETCDIIEIEGNYYESLLTDQGMINSRGVFSSYCTLRNPNKKKSKQRKKKLTPGG